MLAFPQQKWQLARAISQRRESLNLIVNRLYLGDLTAASDGAKLAELGITHVVSVLELTPDIPDTIGKDNHLHISINDVSNADILCHLERTTEFIKTALGANENNKVLVHCLMGISRSATVVAAYLVATRKMTATDAIGYLQKKRTVVSPNLGFRQQLDEYALKYVVPDESKPAQFLPLRQIKAWSSVVKVGRASTSTVTPAS